MQVEYKKYSLKLDIIINNTQYIIKIYKHRDIHNHKFIYYDKLVISDNSIYSSNGNELIWICCQHNILHKKHLKKVKKMLKYLKEYYKYEVYSNKLILIFGKKRYILEL